MDEKSLVGFPEGTLKRMEMPRFMNGLTERQREKMMGSEG
jgi:1-acyl-sn-glycerol-3-phosphate acyltransferase